MLPLYQKFKIYNKALTN